jgi:hypothetical protein
MFVVCRCFTCNRSPAAVGCPGPFAEAQMYGVKKKTPHTAGFAYKNEKVYLVFSKSDAVGTTLEKARNLLCLRL